MNLSWVQRASAVPPWWGDDSCALIKQSGWYHNMIPTTFHLSWCAEEKRLFTTRYKSPLLGSKEPQGIGQTPILCGLILCEAYSID